MLGLVAAGPRAPSPAGLFMGFVPAHLLLGEKKPFLMSNSDIACFCNQNKVKSPPRLARGRHCQDSLDKLPVSSRSRKE